MHITSALLKGLKFIPWCLDYWVDPSLPDQAILTIGDIGGQVIKRQRKCKIDRKEKWHHWRCMCVCLRVCVCSPRSVHYILKQPKSLCLRDLVWGRIRLQLTLSCGMMWSKENIVPATLWHIKHMHLPGLEKVRDSSKHTHTVVLCHYETKGYCTVDTNLSCDSPVNFSWFPSVFLCRTHMSQFTHLLFYTMCKWGGWESTRKKLE